MEDGDVARTLGQGVGSGNTITRAYRFARQQYRANGTFVRFLLSGLFGYALYQGSLFVAYDLGGLRLLIATIISAEASIVGGFPIRDRWVFKDGPVVRRSYWARFIQFQAKSLVSTLGIVGTTVNVLTGGLGVPHYLSTPIGVVLAFGWNWGWERTVIWRQSKTQGE